MTVSVTASADLRAPLAKAVIGLSAAATLAVVAAADVFNATHLFNPDWPAHARFHVAMQFTTLALVSAVSFAALRGPLDRSRAWRAGLAPLTFWTGLFVAWAVPGTDAYATEALRAVGFPVNLALAAVFLTATAAGVALAPVDAQRR